MKKLLLILLCVPLMFSCGEKEEKKEEKFLDKDGLMEQFNKDLKRSIEASNLKEWDVTIDMTYPKLFDYITKEQMIENLKSSEELYKSLNIIASDIDWYGMVWNSKGEIKEYPIVSGSGHYEVLYTRYYYDAEINMIFHNIYDFEASLQSFIEVVGEDNIRYDENTLLIQINKKMSTVAILDYNSSEWKYLEWSEKIGEIIPALKGNRWFSNE
jgi:hypothetical protein